MSNTRHYPWKYTALACAFCCALLALGSGRWVSAQEHTWSAPQVISAPPGFSWFPDLAADEAGVVHAVWCETTPQEDGTGLSEQVTYAYWDGQSWSVPNDVVPPSADIVRNAVATDLAGNVHLLFGGSVYDYNLALYHQKARISEAWSAAVWSRPHRINQGASYMGDIAADSQGNIHLIYDDALGQAEDGKAARSDIFYRRSSDGGQIWSTPINFYPEPLTGSARSYLEIDSSDVLHVTWDEGWDRLTGIQADTFHSVYVFSSDWGETWSPPTIIDYPDNMVRQLTVGSDGRGGVMLVWRTSLRDEIFYQWSADGGRSWGAPAAIPAIFARVWTTPFDMYDLAADSAGHIHLLVVGRETPDRLAETGVYHLVWDGAGWSTPTKVFASQDVHHPEYPKIIVQEGNRLHAAWFTREGSQWEETDRLVWYSQSQSSAPRQAITPHPTATPIPPTPTPSPMFTVTPYPTYGLTSSGMPTGLYTDHDDMFKLLKSLSPLALALFILAFIKTRGFGKFRR
ncbi:MAG: sialidase family protein [Anaerolineae bacterium]|jgi:hypothetical protein